MNTATFGPTRPGEVSADTLAADDMALSQLMEFDHVIEVSVDHVARGARASAPFAPEVYHSPGHDVEVMGDRWEMLTGYTGQYGYRGAVMHSSEMLSGRMAADILAEPGLYVAVVVEVWPEDAPEDRWPGDSEAERMADYSAGAWQPEPAGWAVARWVGESA